MSQILIVPVGTDFRLRMPPAASALVNRLIELVAGEIQVVDFSIYGTGDLVEPRGADDWILIASVRFMHGFYTVLRLGESLYGPLDDQIWYDYTPSYTSLIGMQRC